ncbi:MAG: rod shape-determining protein MreC [Bacteroidales bacterium]|nr:rod shape-determining protein MreC [Bacteroidales bacterium]
MYNLLAFFWKYRFFAFFVLLEVVSLWLLSNSYSYHKSLRFNAVNDATGNLFSSYNNVASYFSLRKENEKLLAENALLRNSLPSSFLITDTAFTFTDSLYHYLPARVLSNSVNKRNNFILVNKGWVHGVEKEMGVISGQGIAGIVIGTSKHYSSIMSVLHQNSRISGRIKKNKQLVTVVWNGQNYSEGLVSDIPSHIRLQRGDTIVTSGNSLIFPEGIVIGTVTEQRIPENKSLGEATLVFGTDFNGLQHVYLIKNKMKPEQDSLVNGYLN